MKTGSYSVTDQFPLELGNACEDAEDQPAIRCRRIHAFMQADELDAQAAKLFKRVHQLAEAAGKAIVAVDHDRIHLALPAITPKPVEFRPMLGFAAHAVHVLAGDLPASPIRVLHQLAELHLGVLS